MDNFLLKAIAGEIGQILPEYVVTKIQSPSDHAILLSFRKQGQNHKFIISWHHQLARFHLTSRKWGVQKSDTLFCQILKKYLLGAQLIEIKMPPGERVLSLCFSLPYEKDKRLCLTGQFFGAYNNVILWDQGTHDILDTALTLFEKFTSIETILFPGLKKTSELYNPFKIGKTDFSTLYAAQDNIPFDQFLRNHFHSLGNTIRKEAERALTIQAGKSSDSEVAWSVFANLIARYSQEAWSPHIRFSGPPDEKFPLEILPFLLVPDANAQQYETFAQACDDFFSEKQRQYELENLQRTLLKNYQKQTRKIERTISKLEKEKSEANKCSLYRKYGDLILSQLPSVHPGKEVTLPDIFSESATEITISLDPSLTAVENARKYYKLSSKLKRRNATIAQRIADFRSRLLHLEKMMNQISDSSDLEYLKNKSFDLQVTSDHGKKSALKKKLKTRHEPFHRFLSSDGWQILVGRDKKENDLLTIKEANSDDFWFHVRQGRGSHVVVKNPKRLSALPQKTLIEAAMLAGHYSKARNDQAIDVMVTQKKYIRKPKGFAPGLVLVEKEKNIRVEMIQETVRFLLNSKK
ncbi:NFACT family protein [candidate division CSSED10-310 bacterium]|uniref:NFACT family protein n=1 Tax=candidate division CSSED10-310 bacterium TaxID=2855610 RepID=A0ABV6YZX5_UNCC1